MNLQNQKMTKRKSLTTTKKPCEFCGSKYAKLDKHYKTCKIAARLIEIENNKNAYYIWLLVSSNLDLDDFDQKLKFAKSGNYTYIMKFLEEASIKNLKFIREYSKWLIDNKIPIKQWAGIRRYSEFVKFYINRELPRDAVNRSIEFINNRGSLGVFFKTETIARILLFLETGSISPWLLFLYPNQNDFFERMNDEQMFQFQKIINIDVWTSKINRMQRTIASLKEDLTGFEI